MSRWTGGRRGVMGREGGEAWFGSLAAPPCPSAAGSGGAGAPSQPFQQVAAPRREAAPPPPQI